MREVREARAFKRNLKTVRSGRYGELVFIPDGELWGVVAILANDEVLPLTTS